MSKSGNENVHMSDEIHKSLDGEKIEKASQGEEKIISTDVSKFNSSLSKVNGEHEDLTDKDVLQLFSETEAGLYYLGPIVKKCVRSPFTQYLARKKGTDEYYLMKVLVVNETKEKFCLHRRAVIHTEYSILSLLKGHPGVIQLHDFFKESLQTVDDEGTSDKPEEKRICMVLECLIPHGCHNTDLVPLSEYLAEKKRLVETEALYIFLNILLIIEDLHKMNIVHKDLKPSNIILNRRTLKVKFINFYYAKLLSFDNEVLYNQRGSPSYTPPDVIPGKPVSPKPCDMWAAGVLFYTMLHGYVPFVGNANWGSTLTNTRALADLYSKIISNDYVISDDICVSDGAKMLVKALLCKEPSGRLKASQAVRMTYSVLAFHSSQTNGFRSQLSDQVVPECLAYEQKTKSPSHPECVLIVDASPPNSAARMFKIAISELSLKASKLIRQKTKGPKNQQDRTMSSENLLEISGRGKWLPVSKRTANSRHNKIKVAMLRLGATSVNNISALSFNYSDRTRSQL